MRRRSSSHLRALLRAPSRSFIGVLVATALLLAVPAPFAAPAFASSTWYVDTATRSEAEVHQMWQQYQPTYSGPIYSVTPSTKAPYATGTVRAEFLADGMRTINFARYLAGLPYDVVLNTTRTNEAQHGAVLLAASNFSHEPAKPADMSQSFYDTGLRSTKASNIGLGHSSLASFQMSCLNDSSSAGNLRTVGHRRWLLNPPMKMTGLGYADMRSTTYVFDKSRTEKVEYSAITWPSAGVFPIEFFGSEIPWSITLNPARYDWDTTGHTVRLQRVEDGRTWTFNASHTNTSGHYFSTDFRWMGVNNVFVFRPNPSSISYQPGDEFSVTLSGGIYHKGTKVPANIMYRTRFMSLEDPSSGEGQPVTVQHNSGGVVFDRWVSGHKGAYSGGGYVYSRWPDVWLEARFVGSKIRWIGPQQPNYGKAEVYIDGQHVDTIDQYVPRGEATLSATIWESPTLSEGEHTLRIRVLGQRHPDSTGDIVVVDRFEVSGTSAAPAAVRIYEANSQASFTGSWVRGRNSAYFGRGYDYSRWRGSSYKSTFTGTKVAWIGPRTGAYGRVEVFINGVSQGTVCQHGSTGWRYRVWESRTLPRGTHTLEIRVNGTKSSPSSGYNIVVDALDITP